jgi:hypothetical protein
MKVTQNMLKQNQVLNDKYIQFFWNEDGWTNISSYFISSSLLYAFLFNEVGWTNISSYFISNSVLYAVARLNSKSGANFFIYLKHVLGLK